MDSKSTRPEHAAELRKRAGDIAREKAVNSAEDLENLPPEEMRKMLRELRVHQIELEMQNEELLRSQAELDSSRARYIDLYDLAPVGFVTISEKGLILEANLTAANLLDVPRGAMVKQPLSNFIRKEDQDVYHSWRKRLLELGEPQSCELRIVKKDGTELWMNLVATASQDTEGVIVCRVVMTDIAERKRVEEVLQESEEQFRRMFMNAPMPYQSLDENGNFIEVNSTFLNAMGYSRNEVIGKNFGDFLHPNMVNHFKENFPRFKAVGEVLGVEFEMVKKDGSTVFVSFNGKIQRDDQGHFQRTHCIFQDITKRKREEKEILLSRERLEESQRIAKIGNWEADLSTGELYWSGVIFDIFGLDSNTFRPSVKAFYNAVHPDDIGLVIESEKRSEQTGVHDVIHRIVRTNGEVRFVHEMAKRYTDNDGKLIMLRGTVQDITDRQQAEEALRTTQQIIEGIIQAVPVRVFWKDLNLHYLGCNSAFANDAGLNDPKNIIGKDDYQMGWRDQAELYRCDDRQVIESGCPKLLIEEPQSTPEGKTITLLTSKIPLRGFEGRIIGVLGAYMDITDRKLAEAAKAELEAQNRQLQKAESLSRMAGAIAHRFNNQLSVVIGNLESTMEDLSPSGVSAENLSEAMKSAQKAAEISGLMLTYLGQTTGKQEPMDICEVCNRNLRLLRATLPKTICLEANLSSPGPTINVNEKQIQLVLTNLITNAGESYDDEGSIYLIVTTVSAKTIPRSYRYPIDFQPQDTAYACLEIRDTGCGIAEKDIEKIFDPFFTTKFTGRGLGLAVVLGILKAHHGAITVESKSGQGSIFRVFLPVSAEVVARLSEKIVMTPTVEGSGTVLLVEDEEQVRKMSVTMLTRLGFMVLQAKDGVEAVEVFCQHKDEIRWVLCDLTMPRMNGWETLAALRTFSPSLPVILASGHDEGRVMADDHPERPNAFLHKPFSRKELAEAIRKAGRRDFESKVL